MSVVGIIPIRSFSAGKLRLAEHLDSQQRETLAIRLGTHVATTVEAAGLIPLIVTSDPEVAEWAIRAGFGTAEDPGMGLDKAAMAGMEWASTTSSPWLVIHSDLPLLAADDVRALQSILSEGGRPVAPSLDGGTSALGGVRPFDTAYGGASFHRHLALMDSPTVVATTGLLHDIDTAPALASAARHARGRWLSEFTQ